MHPANKKNTLLLLSPSLKREIDGHNYNYNLALARAAGEFFEPVIILADRAYQGRPSELIRPLVRRPYFEPVRKLWDFCRAGRDIISSPPAAEAKAGLSDRPPYAVSGLSRWPALFQRSALILGTARRYAKALARQLAPWPGALVFIEDTSFWELSALEFMAERTPFRWRSMLRVPPACLAASFALPLPELARRLGCLVDRVVFYADTRPLAEAYRELTGRLDHFKVLPTPVLQPFPPVKARRGIDLRLGYMGSPRLNKGFTALPWLYENLPPGLAGLKVVLAVQIAPETDTRVRAVVRRLAELAVRPVANRPKLELFKATDGLGRYAELFSGLDIVLLLYTDYHYRFASSGVFVEAVQAGRPVLT